LKPPAAAGPERRRRMQIRFSAKHMNLTPAIEEYATKKIEKFTRYFDRVQEVEVLIDRAKNGYAFEIITNVAGHDPFVATSDGEDLYACIDQGIDRSIRQLTDHKSRLRDNKHNTPTAGNES
jgi:putative sigma-54 modulation protein